MNTSELIFDRGPLGAGTRFAKPLRVIRAETAAEVTHAFDALQQAQADGYWLAGYASYELGYLLSTKLEPLLPQNRDLPLLHFGVFDAPEPASPFASDEAAKLHDIKPLWAATRYAQAFEIVHAHIVAGDIYQANLTFPISAQLQGSPAALYQRLQWRQAVPHGAFVALEDTVLLSRSPELFFSLSAEGTLTARPMKGTAPVGGTEAENAALRSGLMQSEKDRAENLMIVDLLRNDMSRVSEIGSVKVPELFTVERFATVHQMTSRITSQLRAGVKIRDIFEALFPCGSVTGAPKIRAMQIIHDVEAGPRAAYCGSIGWIAPGGAMEFNVAIRTLHCKPDGTVRLNVGGGVVYDSTAEAEYREALLKSRFADLC
ncbi:aminodeoxychorismate synthase component I [Roseobacter cerasinus]|uniref:Aminodeoxychorismate synthase component I n=1 Tax=Roseobacter cerasinus TaxID=2602289 RepID=A0A640VUR4_9RHOB|nr:aminodeoxychorismate synthase component I [Roseobacter cerasinus]GFE51597.1 aminodeoxychorismate synthase component I [Roseobacter cerasinus]